MKKAKTPAMRAAKSPTAAGAARVEKMKTMSKQAVVQNINGLGVGDRAHCGPYGIVRCSRAAVGESARKFVVSGSKLLANRGNWTMSGLRRAIGA